MIKDTKIFSKEWIRENTDMYLNTIQVDAGDLLAMIDEIEMLNAKLDMVGSYIETEDGIFAFPDGDYLYTKKIQK